MKSSPMKRGSGLKRTGNINQVGRITQQRRDRRAEWIKDHPPMQLANGETFYVCHICEYFGEDLFTRLVSPNVFMLEHIVPKGRLTVKESEEDSNLAPAHSKCNEEKGSQLLCQMKTSPMTGKPNPYI